MSETESWGELIDSARRKRPEALGLLYEQYAGRVLGYLRGLGVPDPEDTTGDVFVCVVRDISRFDGDEDGFRRWLFTIAHRRAVDARRQRARRMEDSTDPSILREVGGGRDDVSDAVTAAVTAEPAVRALELLTDDQRAVLLLRVVADLSVADVAEVLAKESGAVKTLQRRALAALRRRISIEAVS